MLDGAQALDLRLVPGKPLERTSGAERQGLGDVIGSLARWPGFGASVATKVLRKKRRRLIPDNQAILGAYMNPAARGTLLRREGLGRHTHP